MSGLIVHEWIEANGGAEKVVAAMVEAFPDAGVFALWDDAPGSLGSVRVQESWLARTPLRRHKVAALPLLPLTWRGLLRDQTDPDFLLVSSHLFAHHVRAGHGGGRGRRTQHDGRDGAVPKLVYAHTPARYIWTPELDARGDSLVARAASRVLQPLDRRRAREATAIAANSMFIADRVRSAWHREAEVIHPPVEVEAIAAGGDWSTAVSETERQLLEALPEGFLLGASRMVPYKALDRVIRAGELVDRPVVLAGGGPDEARLRTLAGAASIPVCFVGRVSDALLFALYQRCAAYVFPPVEDFGIMPVEAMAAGAPVVCNEVGGAKESLRSAGVGAAVSMDDDASLREGLGAALAGGRVAPGAMADFSRSRFVREIRAFVTSHLG